MAKVCLSLFVLPEYYSIIQLKPSGLFDFQQLLLHASFFSLTITQDELSIICKEGTINEYLKCDNGWRAIKIINTSPLTSVGILNSVVEPLAKSKINLFAVSTFDTDYVLVQDDKLNSAKAALLRYGHVFSDLPD
jgi:hypothetical protein